MKINILTQIKSIYNDPKNNKNRFLTFFLILVPFILLSGAIFVFFYRSPFPCILYMFLRIYCPGCGAGRAFRAILHFDLIAAIGHNVLFVGFFPFVSYFLVVRYFELLFRRKNILPLYKFGNKMNITILIIVIVFSIFRNIPFAPFYILAP